MDEMDETYNVKLEANALGAKVGDWILDAKTLEVGKVIKEGRIGNYDIIYVKFKRKKNPVRVKVMDDAQCTGRFYKLIRITEIEEVA